MRIDDFHFDLPPDRIAQHPARPRDAARLLRVADRLEDRFIADLPRLLAPGDLLVVNDTRVLPSRLTGRRDGVSVEVTLLRPLDSGRWLALARPARRLKPGQRIAFTPDLDATVRERTPEGGVVLGFDVSPEAVAAALETCGRMPLPPYISRRTDPDTLADADRADYQTVFACRPGAVAAPTAGLHFTPSLVRALTAAGIDHVTVTLHVGAGTFKPVTADKVEDHVMDGEWGEVRLEAAAAINAAREAGRRIVAVGTTSLRLLETAIDEAGRVRPFCGETRLFILPGFRFRVVDVLLTNFHLPRSTLYMLVAAFSGLGRIQAAYRHAIASGYRFYSYGDACLLSRADPS